MRTSTKSLAAGFCVTGLLLAGCGSSSDGASGSDGASSSQQTEDVTISDAWARTSAMGTTTGVVYVEITATGVDALIDASVPASVAASTEVHETAMEGMDDEGHADDEMDETSDEGHSDDDEMDEMDDTSDEGHADEEGHSDDEMDEEGHSDDEMDDMGNMTMSQVEAIELPAGETVALEPGSYHIMMLELAEPLEAGQSIEVTLEFENAGTKTVTAEVRDS